MDRSRHVLGAIHRQEVELVVWQREPPDYLPWLDRLPGDRLPCLRWSGAAGAVHAAVDEACEACRMPGGPERSAMLRDIAGLADRLAELTGCHAVDLRLNARYGQPCPRWHRDAVELRLLCTLRGPGTEFGMAGPGEEPQRIARLSRGDVGLLRGTGGFDEASLRLVHRSPPPDRGLVRLLLAIDPIGRDETGELHPR